MPNVKGKRKGIVLKQQIQPSPCKRIRRKIAARILHADFDLRITDYRCASIPEGGHSL
jgi:hypothetical protein